MKKRLPRTSEHDHDLTTLNDSRQKHNTTYINLTFLGKKKRTLITQREETVIKDWSNATTTSNASQTPRDKQKTRQTPHTKSKTKKPHSSTNKNTSQKTPSTRAQHRTPENAPSPLRTHRTQWEHIKRSKDRNLKILIIIWGAFE